MMTSFESATSIGLTAALRPLGQDLGGAFGLMCGVLIPAGKIQPADHALPGWLNHRVSHCHPELKRYRHMCARGVWLHGGVLFQCWLAGALHTTGIVIHRVHLRLNDLRMC